MKRKSIKPRRAPDAAERVYEVLYAEGFIHSMYSRPAVLAAIRKALADAE